MPGGRNTKVIPRVAVIGAGASGLATAKSLLEVGVEPIVFERSCKIGGVWNYDERLDDGGGPAYRSLHTNTSRRAMAFSDFPLSPSLPDFPSRSDVLTYLVDYAQAHHLIPHIRFQTDVVQVSPLRSGRWSIRANLDGNDILEEFDGVAVCVGMQHRPIVPSVVGLDSFQGEVTHSCSYKCPEPFAGRDVVVVGSGSSSADIAVEISKVAGRVYLSSTNGAWFVPHMVANHPYDYHLTRISSYLPYQARMRAFETLVRREYRSLGLSSVLAKPSLEPPAFDPLKSRVTVSTELAASFDRGTVVARPGVIAVDDHQVHFTDGNVEHADRIVFGTGYSMEFPFLDSSITSSIQGGAGLFRRVFHPDLPGLAFIGLVVVAGPLPPIAEMQARWVAQVMAGAAQLPASAAMNADVRRRLSNAERLGRRPDRVDLLSYMDEIASLIGARPMIHRHLSMAIPLLSGPFTAAQYRLDGPSQWVRASESVSSKR